MARTPSNMIALESKAPDFSLLNTIDNTIVTLNAIKGKKGTVILFICNHCPFVIHINNMLVKLANDYLSKEITFVAISSNDIINYPQDSPELMKQVAFDNNYPFPYLYDETQSIAKAYDAACTPDIFVYDHMLKLKYRGQFDDSRPGNGVEITGLDLSNAIDCIIENRENKKTQKPSIGCNIKWKNS